jgi:hypothetical protein
LGLEFLPNQGAKVVNRTLGASVVEIYAQL